VKTNYAKLLKSKQYSLGVWGTGYIGFSTMAFFAKFNIKTIGYDISPEKVALINRGDYIFSDLKKWLRFPVRPLVHKGLLQATTDYNKFSEENVIVHCIAIPTEKEGKPYFTILKDVIHKISRLIMHRTSPIKPLIIVESTLSPRTTDSIILPLCKACGITPGKDFLLCVAPRRDWFVEGSKNLVDLDRVYGGYDTDSAQAAHQVLSIVCTRLHQASNCYVSEMVKSFENAYRHVEITLANQISLAYPSQNIREALELAGTKWNVGTFRPGFGTGGYCIPVASKYVLDGAEFKKELSILRETIKTDDMINIRIAESLIKRKFRKIGCLGLSYKGNLKVSILSPTIPFVRTLVARGATVEIFDPYFSQSEISDILGIKTFSFPDDLGSFDAIVLITDHKEYALPKAQLLRHLRGCTFILDNTGLWKRHRRDFAEQNITFHLAGDSHWL